MRRIRVDAGEASYPVFAGRGLLERAGELMPRALRGRLLAVVTDETVWSLHGAALSRGLEDTPAAVLSIPPGEGAKSLKQAGRLFTGLLEAGLDRRSVVLAFGGGVVGDLAGFVAATFMRGVALVQVPTTLLAMVDSSVGGKVAVNHPLGKNTIGAFHQPRAVIADLATLDTLPPRELAAGAAEAVKYGLLGDRKLLAGCRREPFAKWDLETLVARSVRDKAAVVALDEKEAGPRRRLNLGHTFGHALESATAYRRYLHGEAVAIGTLYALRLSILRGLASEVDYRAVRELYGRLGLPLELPRIAFGRYRDLMHHDKKATGGRLLFVLPAGLGGFTEVTDLSEAELRSAFDSLKLDLTTLSP